MSVQLADRPIFAVPSGHQFTTVLLPSAPGRSSVNAYVFFKDHETRAYLFVLFVCFPGVTTHCGCIFTGR
jgi:hypothetical protein